MKLLVQMYGLYKMFKKICTAKNNKNYHKKDNQLNITTVKRSKGFEWKKKNNGQGCSHFTHITEM